MKTLVTGVSSDVGRHLSAHLINHGHQVIGFDIRESADMPDEVRFVRGDVRDYASLEDAAQGCDTGIHLAVQAGSSATEDIFNVNVSGAYNFMAATRKHKFRNAVVASSAPVHLAPDRAEFSVLLRTSQDDDHAYDLSKVLQEEVARDFHTHETPVMCLRFGHIVWGERGMNLSAPTPLADFEYCRGGWVALEDVVVACTKALETSPSNEKFEILNVVGAKGARARYEIEAVEQRLGFEFAYDFACYE